MRQALVFLKDWYKPGCVMKARPVPVPEEPSRVWTLFRECDENKPPSLPFVPIHGQNAFSEDYVHDWNWRKVTRTADDGTIVRVGMLDYGSRVMDRPVWVLLEYNDTPSV